MYQYAGFWKTDNIESKGWEAFLIWNCELSCTLKNIDHTTVPQKDELFTHETAESRIIVSPDKSIKTLAISMRMDILVTAVQTCKMKGTVQIESKGQQCKQDVEHISFVLGPNGEYKRTKTRSIVYIVRMDLYCRRYVLSWRSAEVGQIMKRPNIKLEHSLLIMPYQCKRQRWPIVMLSISKAENMRAKGIGYSIIDLFSVVNRTTILRTRGRTVETMITNTFWWC